MALGFRQRGRISFYPQHGDPPHAQEALTMMDPARVLLVGGDRILGGARVRQDGQGVDVRDETENDTSVPYETIPWHRIDRVQWLKAGALGMD